MKKTFRKQEAKMHHTKLRNILFGNRSEEQTETLLRLSLKKSQGRVLCQSRY